MECVPQVQALGHGVKVLVVDDRVTERARIAAGLRADGYTVRTVRSVGQALRALAHERFDLIVTDAFLHAAPGQGADAFDELLAAAPGARVIVLTRDVPAQEPRERQTGTGRGSREPRRDQVDVARVREQVRAALTR
jgi:CheY-like chemotaxis protein